ncbi:hypothetical protein CRM22_000323 [Opisthorchis felineus]|uniref:Calcium-activated potassium channel BK alpha subunit domain-containing protein n=1 Tax=Opisthorchis felineus TaxID=147828 RepID=A0A4S2MFT2_OPIFE|nr:hypothetical protein CRM22_000323 [Opisthorchis felineus]
MQNLQLLLVAVHIYSQKDTVEQIVINPGTYLRINSQQMRAIVLADSFLHAQHLRAYCVACNSDSGFHLHEPLRTCRSRLQMHNSDPAIDKGSVASRYGSLEVSPSKGLGFRISQLLKPFVNKKVLKRALSSDIHQKVAGNAHKYEQPKLQDGTKPKTTIDIMRDSTGLFYWVPDRPFTSACLSLRDLIQWSLSGHILVCLTKQTSDAKLGLASFVMPLRSTRIPKEELRPIVFLCDENLVRTEWYSLRNFPKIYVLSGSPLSRAYLRAAGVEKCSTCVILSCSDEIPAKQSLLADKENILCALNIRQMLAENRGQDEEENIRSGPMVITALSDMKSGSLLSITNEYKSKNGLIRLSPHYAAGSMFASPVLNSLASNVFFDPTALTFLETVILGGPSHEVEKLFAEDSGLFPDLLGHKLTSLEFTGINSETQTDRGQKHSTPRDQTPVIANQQSTVSLFTGESTSGGAKFSIESMDNDQPISMKAPDVEPLMSDKHAVLSSVQEMDSEDGCVAANDHRKSMSAKTGQHRISWANLDEPKFADYLTVDSDLLTTNVKRSLTLPWGLSTSTSFLSYTTETGDSIKMRAPYIRLLPLSTLGVDPVKIMRETNAYLTFGNLFEMVLMASSTICIGLYRRVVDEMDEDQQSERSDTVTREVGSQIERYVYTFPDVDTEIMAEDLVYCFASVKEIRGTDD